MEFAFIAIGTIVLLIGLLSFKIIPASKFAIVEYLGAHSRTIETPGTVFVKPFLEKVYFIDRITVIEVRDSEISINGKRDFEVNFDVTFQVINAQLYYYSQKNPKNSLKDLILKEMRIYLSEHQVFDILETKKELKDHMIKVIKALEETYFIELKSLDILSLVKPNENI